jgi:hypothetical protein
MCVAIDGLYTTLVLFNHHIVIWRKKILMVGVSVFEKTMFMNHLNRMSGRDHLIALDWCEIFKIYTEIYWRARSLLCNGLYQQNFRTS